jgi:hypothetical protein
MNVSQLSAMFSFLEQPESLSLRKNRHTLRYVFLLPLLLVTLSASAQVQQGGQLQEVQVKAARVVHRPYGDEIFPSSAQVEASTDAYSLLRKLNLPGVVVDDIGHTIRPVDNNGGEVQVRINGALASKADLQMLNPKQVKRVEFISNPGTRYGEEVAFVIDIKLGPVDQGYDLGLDARNTLTSWQGDNMAYAKAVKGNSEWGLTYDFDYADQDGRRVDEESDYLLTDGTTKAISRRQIDGRDRHYNHSLQAKYTHADSTGNVLQATFSTAFDHTPNDDSRMLFVDGTTEQTVNNRSRQRETTPSLDLYLSHKFGGSQTLIANVVGTTIATHGYSYQDEGTPYSYHIDGDTYSLLSEAIYENRLRPFTLSLGARQTTKYTHNEYSGDVASINDIHNSSLYFYAELTGRLGHLDYVVGVGASNRHYRQADNSYDHWYFRPKFTLAWRLAKGFQLSYSFDNYDRLSKVALVNDTRMRVNSMEWVVGNPNLRPTRVTTQELKLGYSVPRLSLLLYGEYRQNHHPNMAKYIRTDDNQFLYTQQNQRSIDLMNVSLYANYEIIPDHLTAMGNLIFSRFFNRGDDYEHLMNNWSFSGALQAYLGQWTLQAYLDTGWKFEEGESWNRDGLSSVLAASYRMGPWTFSLNWQMPFQSHPLVSKGGTENRYVHKYVEIHNADAGNCVSLHINYRLSRGRKAKEVRRRLNNKDSDSGVM